jgi:parallel beta-helix repeat protein
MGAGGAIRWAGTLGITKTLGASIAVALAAAVGCSSDDTPRVGAADVAEDPQDLIHAVSLRDQYQLPPMRDTVGEEIGRVARVTQVFQRAEMLDLDAGTAHAAWSSAAETVATSRGALPALLQQPLRRLEFEGRRLSELGELVDSAGSAHITVVGRKLLADAPLTITGRDVVIDFAGAIVEAGPAPPTWVIELRGAQNVAVTNADIRGGTNGILVHGASDVVVEGNGIRGLEQNGIVVSGGSSTTVRDNRLHGLHRAGIMLHGGVTNSLIEGNVIRDLLGHSNWHPGILITGRNSDVAADPEAFNRYSVADELIVERLQNPYRNVILGNVVRNGLGSGIYNDGSIANLILANRIEANAKEGICLDNGATSNVVAGNTVTGNGNRWGQPDEVLANDYVLHEGRAPDGTAIAKLPGISVDNAVYNEIYGNEIYGNWGGGIKMVRTSLFNVIANNTLTDNNLGRSARFHYFGIELGAAVADEPVRDLDFIGSSGNIIVANVIRGSHHFGIFIPPESIQNEIIDNNIEGAEAHAIEQPG